MHNFFSSHTLLMRQMISSNKKVAFQQGFLGVLKNNKGAIVTKYARLRKSFRWIWGHYG
jgi:hypothetical protein